MSAHPREQVESEHLLKVRTLRRDDYKDLLAVTQEVYAAIGDTWTQRQFNRLISLFPEGQICVEDKGKVVAFALSIMLKYEDLDDNHTYNDIIGNHQFDTHNAAGDILYGIEICVSPEVQNLRLGRRLYDARKELCENLNLRGIIVGGRMPNYHKHAEELDARGYLEKVKTKSIYDPVLSFQLSNDFHIRTVVKGYLPYDSESKAFAVLLEWNNIWFEPKSPSVGKQKKFVRLGLVQWQMRSVAGVESLLENVEFFVDSVASYNADFLLLPELFNAPLMARFNEEGMAQAIRSLAGYTEQIRDQLLDWALSYNINIIAGSMPLVEDDKLYNVSYICRRDGSYDAQAKLHITPSEVGDWGMQGGDSLRVFDTDCGRVGILICYDVEFPELARILAANDMRILFVPFSTDSRNGYLRVRLCSQARAVENECYVAIAGSVGNLPKVSNMDVQYAQSAVFSPSDFAFPNQAVVAEATPNTETVVIADVDLTLLDELHTLGSVRNLIDRRDDLYDVVWKSASGPVDKAEIARRDGRRVKRARFS